MTAAHTPGPWQIEEGHIQRDSGGIRYWQVTDGQDAIACNQFCYAGYNPEVNAANARLIAAAPELLALVEKIDRWIQRSEDDDDDCEYLNGEGWDDLLILQVAARAAIAKATGAA